MGETENTAWVLALGFCGTSSADSFVDDVQYQLQEAIRFYDAWGAAGKVEALKKQLDSLV